MKTAIVNLSRFTDVSGDIKFEQGLTTLYECGIEVVDYASRRDRPSEMVAGLHEALTDSEVGVVLTYSGGTGLIECMDLIDWEAVASSGKLFVGLSDFTHFAWKAAEHGGKCAYGLSLSTLAQFWLGTANIETAIEFLRTGIIEPLQPERLLGSDVIVNWPEERLIGGHMIISLVMAQESKLDLTNRVLLLEHHHNQAENAYGLRYWGAAFARMLRTHPPKAVLLGRSMVYDNGGEPLPVEQMNEILCEQLSCLDIPIYYIDHFTSLIPLG